MNLEEIKEKLTKGTLENLRYLSKLAVKQAKITWDFMSENIYSEKCKNQMYNEYKINKLFYEEAVKAKDLELITNETLREIEDSFLQAVSFLKKYTDFKVD